MHVFLIKATGCLISNHPWPVIHPPKNVWLVDSNVFCLKGVSSSVYLLCKECNYAWYAKAIGNKLESWLRKIYIKQMNVSLVHIPSVWYHTLFWAPTNFADKNLICSLAKHDVCSYYRLPLYSCNTYISLSHFQFDETQQPTSKLMKLNT